MTMPEQQCPEEWGSQQPQHWGSTAGSRETLDSTSTAILPASTSGSGRRWALAGVGAALVVGVGGAAVWAATALGGGGTQPEEVVPASAWAFVKADLDPAADQKVGALRFLRAFPETSGDVDDDTDLRRYLFEQVQEQEEWTDVDYTNDVEPWLGQRFAMAVLPPAADGEEPRPLLVVQVEDEDAARAGLAKLTAGSSEEAAFVISQGYALIAGDEATAAAAAQDAQQESLAGADAFSADLDELGGDGVLTAWMDLDAAREDVLNLAQYGSELPLPGAASDLENELAGRVTAAVRFDGAVLEVAGQGSGLVGTYLAEGGTGAGELPEGTLAALGWSDGGALVEQLWTRAEEAAAAFGGDGQDLEEQLEVFEDQYGLALPGDIAVLLGTRGAVGYGGQDAEDFPRVGLRTTGDADEALRVVEALEALANDAGGVVEVVHQPTDDGFVLASTQEYAETLAPVGDLASDEGFEAVVPDADEAGFVLYADVQRVVEAFGDQMDADEREVVESLRSVGLSGTSDGEGAVSFTLRVGTR